MANPYPANFETLGGSGRLTGQVNFTDPANQPGGGSATVQLIGPFHVAFDDVPTGDFQTLSVPTLGTIFLRAWLVTTTAWTLTGGGPTGIEAVLALTSDASGSAQVAAYQNLEGNTGWDTPGLFGWQEATPPLIGTNLAVAAITLGPNPVFEVQFDAGIGVVTAGEADIYALAV